MGRISECACYRLEQKLPLWDQNPLTELDSNHMAISSCCVRMCGGGSG